MFLTVGQTADRDNSWHRDSAWSRWCFRQVNAKVRAP